MHQNFIENLRWRGMIHQVTAGTEAQLREEKVAGYIGFDPTAPSLHIGNLATIMLMKHFQRAGHRPVIVLGGATGMIGDPSGKSVERKLLSQEQLHHNQVSLQRQLERFLDFSDTPQGAVLLNNLAWFSKMDLFYLFRDIGKHLSVNYMIAKESVKLRLEKGISFTEFTYQLLQGYDFYHLYTHHHVKLQMGGSDQWGNLATGLELIRRKTGKSAFALTTPLLTKANGQKFGKTEQGNLWLDPDMTSPYTFYQFWLNCGDEEAKKYIKVFTLLDQETIEDLLQQHQKVPHQRILQKTLAQELTIMVHTAQAYNRAVQTAALLFGTTTLGDLQVLEEQTLLEHLAEIPQIPLHRDQWDAIDDLPTLLSTGTNNIVFKSKGEARRMLQGGGVCINKMRVTDTHQKDDLILLQGKYMLVQRGKQHGYLLVVPS